VGVDALRAGNTSEQKGAGIMKKDVVINIYDRDGDLVEEVHREMDAQELTDQMMYCLKNEGIPVVRMHNEMAKPVDDSGPMLNHQRLNEVFSKPLREYIPHTAEPILMKMEMKVDRHTLVCEGFGSDVLKAQELFMKTIMPRPMIIPGDGKICHMA
jgi:predicted HAD superfamily phosphohydrolase YqeG